MLELSRERVDPNLAVEDSTTAHSHPDMLFPAWAYFEARDDFGSPAFSLDQLEGAGAQAREAADQELVRALALSADPAPSAEMGPGAGCLTLAGSGGSGSLQFEVPPGGFAYRTAPSTEVEVKLRRFGDAPVTELPPVEGSAEVAIPTDTSSVPWRAELRAGTKTLVCRR